MIESLIAAVAAFAVTGLVCLTALRAWRGWLDLKQVELAERRAVEQDDEADVGVRIELAAVKERVKKLEAIASGVEL